jgi:hypothetical protein
MMGKIKDLVEVQQRSITADSLYGSEEDQKALYRAVSKFAPWVKGQHPMSAEEVMLVVRRSTSQGLDPLNPHEVQIWKDRHGVQIQHAYTLMVEWVKHFKGDFTEPQYERLTDHELREEGLEEDDVAYRVHFLMKDDIPLLIELKGCGYDAKEAKRMLEVTGLGVAPRNEYDGDYFAPKGRSKSWKVKKRAMTDAIRRKFGTPTRAEIVELRRVRGDSRLTLEDWVVSAEDGEAQLQLARAAAEERTWREEFDSLSEEEQKKRLEEMHTLLSGTKDDREGNLTDADRAKSREKQEPIEADYNEVPTGPFTPLGDSDLIESAEYQTPKGAKLGYLKKRELSSMLDYILNLENPSNETKELQAHVERCLEYLSGFDENPTIDETVQRNNDEQRHVDVPAILTALRINAGWKLKGKAWKRPEGEQPDNKLIQRAAAVIGHALGGDDDKRHDLLGIVYGESSTKGLTKAEVDTIIKRWEAADDAYKANNKGFFEIHAILEENSLPGLYSEIL